MCTQLTPFKTIWPDFIIVYRIDSFQDHLTQFYHCVPYWLLSRPFNLIFALCTQLTDFKNIWPNFIIVYPIDFFQDHLTKFYHCVPYWLLSRPYDLYSGTNWLLSRPFDIILSLWYTIDSFQDHWPDFIIVYRIDSFQDHLTQFYHCVPNWLLLRSFGLIGLSHERPILGGDPKAHEIWLKSAVKCTAHFM